MSEILKFESGMHYVMVDDSIVQKFANRNSKRAICVIENTRFHCAFMPKKEGGFFINLGSKIWQSSRIKLRRGYK
jgi:hypothetical protein